MRVLFIGNSYTFRGDLPGQIASMVRVTTAGPSITMDQVVRGGATLKQHFESTGARGRIETGEYTHVVLQDKSTQPLHDPEDFLYYAARLGERARARGMSVLLYQTWARREGHAIYRWAWSGRGPAEMTRRIRAAYDDAAARIEGASVVPVGDAFERARREQETLVLHDSDRHHPSPLGSHLAASVFFAWLLGRDPGPIEYLPPGVDRGGARAVRAVAWDTVRRAQS